MTWIISNLFIYLFASKLEKKAKRVNFDCSSKFLYARYVHSPQNKGFYGCLWFHEEPLMPMEPF